jgi:hypothetical protein
MTERLGSPIYTQYVAVAPRHVSNLEEAASRLLERRSADVDQMHELLGVLEPMENYWGFPGRRFFGHMQRLLAAGDVSRFAELVRIRTLAAGAARGSGPVQARRTRSSFEVFTPTTEVFTQASATTSGIAVQK